MMNFLKKRSTSQKENVKLSKRVRNPSKIIIRDRKTEGFMQEAESMLLFYF